MKSRLIRVNILRETNEYGELAYTVNTVYRMVTGEVVSVPDTKGWPTLALALAETEQIAGGKIESF